MKSKVLLFTLMAMVIFTLALYAVDQSNDETMPMSIDETMPMADTTITTVYTGYLSDVHCGFSGTDHFNNDLTKYPYKETVSEMRSKSCMESGYGMFIKDSQNIYTFHRFDSKGSDLAKDALQNLKKKDDVRVIVEGYMQPNGDIMVKNFSFPIPLENPKQTKE